MAGWCDLVALIAMGGGVALMLQPWWADGLRTGFFTALAGIVVQTVTGRMRKRA